MDHYPDMKGNTLTDRLDVVVRLLDACAALHTASIHPILRPDVHGYEVNRKYTRVYCTTDAGAGQRMVCFFVENATGDVYKAGGWKKPVRNFVRGNINTPEGRRGVTLDKMTDTGYFYAGF